MEPKNNKSIIIVILIAMILFSALITGLTFFQRKETPLTPEKQEKQGREGEEGIKKEEGEEGEEEEKKREREGGEEERKEKMCLKIPPLSFPLEDIEVPEISLADIVKKFGLSGEIKIVWPEKLKKITLHEKITIYDIPPIPLSKLSWEKEIPFKLVGLQYPLTTIDLKNIDNYPSCVSKPASAENPCPTGEVENNLNEIRKLKTEIEQTSQKIIDILE